MLDEQRSAVCLRAAEVLVGEGLLCLVASSTEYTRRMHVLMSFNDFVRNVLYVYQRGIS